MAKPLQVSIDGELLAPGDASISITDDGLLRGDGVFEAIKLYQGHPFRLDDHFERLAASAAAIELGFERPTLEREAATLIRRAPGGECMLRIVITRGGRRILLIEEIPEWPERAAIKLVQLSPSELLAGVKSISYAANMLATRIAQREGADEAVYVDREGIVLEAPTSSVFWTGEDGILRTPALQTGILDSITRRVVVEGLSCEQGAYGDQQLRSARSAFLASTTREIQPIATVDGSELPDRDGGDAAAEAARILEEAVAQERAAGPVPQ